MKVRQTITYEVEIEYEVEYGRNEYDEANLFGQIDDGRIDITFPIHQWIKNQEGVLQVARASDLPRISYEPESE